MKVLVVGSGGREHAVIMKLKESKDIDEIVCAPGNGGISAIARCVNVKATNIEGMKKLALDEQVGFCVVTPDDPLALGMVDALEEAGIPCFGPRKDAAIIEASKAFSKELMKKYNIPTASYEIFDDASKAMAYIKERNEYPTVIKADGLALGKGVLIATSEQEAMDAINQMMVDKAFGDSGNKVVVEEFMQGTEVSVLAFTDGKTIKPMVSSMDHKRANDNDEGLNTGGMGTIAPSPLYTDDIAKTCMDAIFVPTMEAMNKEGRTFKGCLYFGLMLTEKGPRVVEYNCRFGDPETQVVLPLLESDLFTIMKACHDETLSDVDVKWSNESAACVIEASGGYPLAYEKGFAIKGLDENGQHEGIVVYHAGTKKENNVYYTNGGRVLGLMAKGDTLEEALDKAYAATKEVGFEKMHYRTDIGKKLRKAQ